MATTPQLATDSGLARGDEVSAELGLQAGRHSQHEEAVG